MSQAERVSPNLLLDLFKERRSIRHYRPDLVPDAAIDRILEAGRWAPSANNLQPWAFVVVRDDLVRDQVAQYARYFAPAPPPLVEAPLLIVLCGFVRDRIYHEYLNGDVGMAALQMMLQAKALGLGSCWIGSLDRDAIAGLLRIPDYYEIVSVLTIGYPAEEPEAPSRRPLQEIVHYELFGRSALHENAPASPEDEIIPGVPVKEPPGPAKRFLNWCRSLIRRRTSGSEV
jgi:nitroreductase